MDKGRYYSVMLTDLYTFNYGYVGSRATGNDAGCYLTWADVVTAPNSVAAGATLPADCSLPAVGVSDARRGVPGDGHYFAVAFLDPDRAVVVDVDDGAQ